MEQARAATSGLHRALSGNGRYASRGGGKLHPAIDNLSSTFTKQTEENHLRELIDKALPYVLPEKEAKSRVLKIAVREVVACSVLYPVMDMLADPDFWNRSIDQLVRISSCRTSRSLTATQAGAAIRQQSVCTVSLMFNADKSPQFKETDYQSP